MAKICLCLMGATLERNREILEKYRRFVDIVELRVDALDPDEYFHFRKFPGLAGIPCILTVRRKSDGGMFSEGEGARIALLSRGLAFAKSDQRHNFAYIDLEEDLDVPGIEEAARAFGTRIIRSYHNRTGVETDMADRIRRIRRAGDEIVKYAVTPQSLEDAHAVLKASKETRDVEKIVTLMGHFGVFARVLADRFGSYITYTSVKGEPDIPQAAPGQLDPRELTELYRFRKINSCTRIFGITGFPLLATSSPSFFNSVFALENTNAVYLPFPSASLEAFLSLAEDLGLSGASITIPHKETLTSFLSKKSEKVQITGACNTIIRNENGGWDGYNTDAEGFSSSLLEFIGKDNLNGKKVAIIGAGGAARSVASEVFLLKGKALILNRSQDRARDLAEIFDFRWGGLDPAGVALIDKYNDIIIQTTSVGMEPETNGDPLKLYKFTGKEAVMDIIYKPPETALLKRAAAAGCRTLNGYDMFKRQAQYQYRFFMRREFSDRLMSEIIL